MNRLLFLISLLLCAVGVAHAKDLRYGDAETVGMSAEALAQITSYGNTEVEAGRLAGLHTMVAREGTIVYDEVVGTRGASDERPLAKDDIYRIFSMTKPIAAVAIMQLYEQGKFTLDDPVAKFLPELKDVKVFNADPEINVEEPNTTMNMRHLLTHTAGFGYVFARHPVDRKVVEMGLLSQPNLDTFVTKLADIPLRTHPGSEWWYSIAVDVTGAAIERISGNTLDHYLEDNIFEPLGMVDTAFSVPAAKKSRFLPNHAWRNEQLLQIPGSEDGYADVTFFSGGGGLVGTSMDYVRFAEALRRGGELDGKRILKKETLDLMTRDHLPEILQSDGEEEAQEDQYQFHFGLGFGLNMTDDVVQSYWWGGAAGTVFWVDPVNQLVVVGMIQRHGGPGIRPPIERAVTASLGEVTVTN